MDRPRTAFLVKTNIPRINEEQRQFTGEASSPYPLGYHSQIFDPDHFSQSVLRKRKSDAASRLDDRDEREGFSYLGGSVSLQKKHRINRIGDESEKDFNLSGRERNLFAIPSKSFHRQPLLFFEQKIRESNIGLFPVDRSVHTVQLKYRRRKV